MQNIWVMGSTGSGKSYFLGGLLEQMQAVTMLFIDPKFDNKVIAESDESFYITKGGEYAPRIADAIMNEGHSIYIGGYPQLSERVKGVLKAIQQIKKTKRNQSFVKILVIDELQFMLDYSVEFKRIMDLFVQTQRSSGWGFIFASQRPVHSAVGAREQAHRWFVFRTVGTNDLVWLKDNLFPPDLKTKGKRSLMSSIKKLKTGRCKYFGPPLSSDIYATTGFLNV
jgi:DNA helicase HerA-like ATPase